MTDDSARLGATIHHTSNVTLLLYFDSKPPVIYNFPPAVKIYNFQPGGMGEGPTGGGGFASPDGPTT